jgi:ADP-ribose pyrophosphatase
MQPIKLVKVEKVTDEKWINLFAATFENRDGQPGRWMFVSRKDDPHGQRDQPDAVIIVPVLLSPDQPPRLVLEKEFRLPVNDYVIGFPAGLLEKGEGVEESVRRELLEETGLEVVRFKRITQPVYSTSGFSDECAVMVFVDARQVDGIGPHLEASEDIEVMLLDYEAVCKLCDDRTVRMDAKTWTVLYMYQLLGRVE